MNAADYGMTKFRLALRVHRADTALLAVLFPHHIQSAIFGEFLYGRRVPVNLRFLQDTNGKGLREITRRIDFTGTALLFGSVSVALSFVGMWRSNQHLITGSMLPSLPELPRQRLPTGKCRM